MSDAVKDLITQARITYAEWEDEVPLADTECAVFVPKLANALELAYDLLLTQPDIKGIPRVVNTVDIAIITAYAQSRGAILA